MVNNLLGSSQLGFQVFDADTCRGFLCAHGHLFLQVVGREGALVFVAAGAGFAAGWGFAARPSGTKGADCGLTTYIGSSG